ncbi:MAG: hypothetical protein IJV43_00590 [Oscillospiraceae bacterium]|nr:hypothetical protein [Oscillospiraceae bacterium]
MGAIEAIAMIGTRFVLISLYRAISCAERRYQTLWHGRKRATNQKTVKFGEKRQYSAAHGERVRRKWGVYRT